MNRAQVLVASVLVAALTPDAAGLAAGAPPPPKKPAPTAAAPQPAPSPPPPAVRPPPYEPQLLRLAEIMGALTYLRELCGHGDGADFRAKMGALLAADGVDQQRRDLLAGAYNKGYIDYATGYRDCGPAAEVVIDRYLSETGRLAADLASRYGG